MKQTKKAMSEIVITLVIIVLALSAIGIVYVVVKNQAISLSPKLSCSDFAVKNSVVISKACYLNENEIQVSVQRSLEDFQLDSLIFSFSGLNNGAKFLLQNKKCSDIRGILGRYGDECRIPKPSETTYYVFNLEGAKVNEIRLAVPIEGNDACPTSLKMVMNNC